MKYYKDSSGSVFAYKTAAERNEWGDTGLIIMTAQEVAAHLNSSAETVIPQAVSRFQARAALYQSGKLAEVEAAIAVADDITQMAWQDAQEFRRNSPTILALGAQLGLDLDALFIAAAQIQA